MPFRVRLIALIEADSDDTIPTNTAALRPSLAAVVRLHLLPLLGYLLATLTLTYPLVRHMSTRLPGDFSDGWQNYWNYWWIGRALADWHSPLVTPLLYAPDGAPLYLHTLNLFGGLTTLPIQWLFGVTAAYNAVVVLSFTLCGYFAYLLVGLVTADRRAGAIGGLIYAFSSYQLMQLRLEHANLYSSEWLVAYIFFLLSAERARGRRRIVVVGAGAVSFLFMLLCDWQYAIFAGIFTLLSVIYMATQRRATATLIVSLAILGVGTVLALPLLIPALLELRSGRVLAQFEYFPVEFSADLLSYVVPSPFHPWWKEATWLAVPAIAPANERILFLGYLPPLLAIAGSICRWKQARFWLLTAMIFAVLSFGPVLHIAGQQTFGPKGWSISLPYLLLQALPGLNIARVPARFGLMVTLCSAVLGGLGIAALLSVPRGHVGRCVLAALHPLLAVLLVAEHLVIPIPLKAVDVPIFYQQLATSNTPGAILEWPLSLKRSESLLYQTVHGRPLIGGYVSRPLVYPLLSLPPYREQNYPANDITSNDLAAAGSYGLRLGGVRWIVVLRDDPRLNQRTLSDFLARYAEPEPVFSDTRTVVYRPRLVAASSEFFTGVENGWYQPEMLEDKHTLMRWFSDTATLISWNLTDAPRASEFRFDAWSFAESRQLELQLDGESIGRWQISAREPHAVSLMLPPGPHRLSLRSLDPPSVPAVLLGGIDTRPLSIGVADVALGPAR